MKAVVLVGGEGTRMRPLTETVPKPLLPFMNRPFFDHVLGHLARHGVDEVICSSPYLESIFHDYLTGRGERAPAVRWITEETPLGTAGAIAGALEYLDETFLVLNGDILTDLDLGGLLAFHRAREAVATIALTPVEDARPFGLVETAGDGRVLAFREKPADLVPGTVNAGMYVLELRALHDVAPGVMVSIERETYPGLIERDEPVFAYVAGGYWRDLGTPAAYLEGHLDALSGELASYRGGPRPLLGEDVRVDGEASVGELVVLGPGCEVASGARIDRSVLHRDAVVAAGASVEGSILGAGAVVEAGAAVRGAVLADRAVVPRGARAEGVRLGPGERLEAAADGAPR